VVGVPPPPGSVPCSHGDQFMLLISCENSIVKRVYDGGDTDVADRVDKIVLWVLGCLWIAVNTVVAVMYFFPELPRKRFR
jgi:hypothetical protein